MSAQENKPKSKLKGVPPSEMLYVLMRDFTQKRACQYCDLTAREIYLSGLVDMEEKYQSELAHANERTKDFLVAGWSMYHFLEGQFASSNPAFTEDMKSLIFNRMSNWQKEFDKHKDELAKAQKEKP